MAYESMFGAGGSMSYDMMVISDYKQQERLRQKREIEEGKRVLSNLFRGYDMAAINKIDKDHDNFMKQAKGETPQSIKDLYKSRGLG